MGPTMVLCPYCGSLSAHTTQCAHCSGHFDLLSRQRSQNSMGPWFIRDLSKPFQPGCSLATLTRMVERGRIKPETVIRGPSTRQFWTFAKNTPGISHLFGECHSCHTPVMAIAKLCPSCNASFVADDDRQNLGLSPVHLLPGDADAATIAAAIGSKGPAPTPPAQRVAPQVPTQQAQQPVPAPAPQPAAEPPAVQEMPDPPFPIPEVRIITADEDSQKPIALMVSLVIAALLVGGVGLWAWGYLANLSDESSPSTEQVTAEVTADDAARIEVPANEIETIAQVEDPLPDTALPELDQDSESQPVEVPDADTETANIDEPQISGDLEFDQAMLGIFTGDLTDADFEDLLGRVSPSQRAELEDARRRRAEQIRLGRDGD